MKVRFWGVRGSIPTPVTTEQIRSKITAAIQRITAKDIESQDARSNFIANLPDWIFGTVGGNSSCVEIKSDEGTEIILDAGSGIRALGKSKNKPVDNVYNLFFSHFHWDHMQGLPFFDPIYAGNSKINVYTANPDAKKLLEIQQSEPFYPEAGGFSHVESKIVFNHVVPGKCFNVGNLFVNLCKMSHPGDSYSFSFEEHKDCVGTESKKVVYATDVELSTHDFVYLKEHETVFKNADCIILDSQYTIEECYKKPNWGHSAFCYAVDFAVQWNAKKLFLFHHEPTYDDKKLDSILTAARWYAKNIVHSDIEVLLAREGEEFEF